MESMTEEEEDRTATSVQSLGGTSTDKSSPGDRDEGGDDESSAPNLAAVGDGKKTAETETPKPHARPSDCLLYTSPSPRDVEESRMPSSA